MARIVRKKATGELITGTVSVESAGETYTGNYTVRDRWITVSALGGSKGAAVHEVPPGHLEIDSIARLLMHEIIGEATRDGRITS